MYPYDPALLSDKRRNRSVRPMVVGDPYAPDSLHPDPLGAALTRALLRFDDVLHTWRVRRELAVAARERRRAEQAARTQFEV